VPDRAGQQRRVDGGGLAVDGRAGELQHPADGGVQRVRVIELRLRGGVERRGLRGGQRDLERREVGLQKLEAARPENRRRDRGPAEQPGQARLRLASSGDVAQAGFAVGYESASQFSRDYRRQFGVPPSFDRVR
jgi:hypothetical protein